MAAIVTDRLKLQLIDQLVTVLQDNSKPTYVGFGRSEAWNDSDTAPVPSNNTDDERKFKNGLQSVKRINGVSHVVPRVNWTSGTIYHGWDNKTTGYGSASFYVLTENFGVYICLRAGRNNQGNLVPSTVQPTGSNNDPFELADGYVWKFLYTISETEARKFMTASFMPTRIILDTDSNSSGIQIKQKEIQDNSDSGRITQVVVTNGGSGYTSAPTVLIFGDGDSAFSATATIDSAAGTVTKVEFDNDSSTLKYGKGYSTANVSLIGGGGTGALARAVIGPKEGFGRNAKLDLKTSSLVVHCKVEGTDSDFILGNDFRQIGLINDLRKTATDSVFGGLTGSVLDHLKLQTVSSVFTADKIIVGTTTGTKAVIDKVDSNKIFYHQNDNTGFDSFAIGETITESNGTGAGIILQPRIPGYIKKHTGDLLYLNNRGAVARSAGQAEDIKIVIQI